MIKRTYKIGSYHFRLFVITVILIAVTYIVYVKYRIIENEKVTVRIDIADENQKNFLQHYLDGNIDISRKPYIEASVNWRQFFFLQSNGLNPALQVTINRDKVLAPYFHTHSEVNELIRYYESKFPELVRVQKIGKSTNKNMPIWGIKVSDNPEINEPEPAVLFSAMHHAKELLGVEVCLYLLEHLCKNYHHDSRIKHWIDNIEIWFVPVINPDGFHLVMDCEKPLQFWRKNLRDNNCDETFDSTIDGVDLNRNYDFNWDVDSNGNPNSWYYRGPYPFSERETQAIRDLTFQERFVFNLDFHSFGEVILYPWENSSPPVDIALVMDIAQGIAKQIQKRTKLEHYSVRPLNGNLGQCSTWMHGRAGVLSYIVEVGDCHFPKGYEIPQIIKQNANAAFFILDRLFEAAICGIIRNGYKKTPMSADVEILEYSSSSMVNPISDPQTGYYHCIVSPGVYSIKFSSPGFRTKVIHSIKVNDNTIETLDVDLYPIEDIFPTEN